MSRLTAPGILLALVAGLTGCVAECEGDADCLPAEGEGEGEGEGECAGYPSLVTDPMAVGGVLPAYSWPESLDAARNNVPLDLANAPCANDPNIEWSPFDHLLFVSIPAW